MCDAKPRVCQNTEPRTAKLVFVVAVLAAISVEKSIALGMAPSVDELEKATLAYRQAFTREGRILLRVLDSPSKPPKIEFEYRIAFADEKLRFDWRARAHGKKQWGLPDKKIFAHDSYVFASPGCAIVKAPATDYENPREHFHAFHPRGLGMTTSGMKLLHKIGGLESLINRADMEVISVERDQIGDYETWKIVKRQGNGRVLSLWVAPECGHSIVRAESVTELSNGRAMAAIDCKLKQYPPDDVWFPSVVEQRNTFDDRVVNGQTITVLEAYFGPLEDNTPFTLAGLELEPGKEIMDRVTQPGTQLGMVWDGTEAVPIDGRPPQPAAPPVELEAGRRWLLVVSAIVLGVLACASIAMATRKRVKL
jgi:hypothetical protein